MVKFLFFFIFSSVSAFSQVELVNPSFEGKPDDSKMPSGWISFSKGTTPDILPGFWEVTTPPSEGLSYLGLIYRKDGTSESIGQKLTTPLKKGICYKMSLDLAHSNTYAGYFMPVELRIYGAKTKDGQKELIYSSEMINHLNWKKYSFDFAPSYDYNYFILTIVRIKGLFFNYNGNLLIDNISMIEKCKQA